MLLALPMILLYELGLLLIARNSRKPAAVA
jgi:Sec-independent protein secretion pathway component TatC